VNWSLESRDGEWCVVDAVGDAVGVHSSRADAIKHQRALYANEARVASMYAELDALPDPVPEPEVVVAAAPSMSPVTAEIMALLLREEKERSLVASVAESQTLISRQFEEAALERQALVAALGRMGSPTINLPPAEVNVNVPPAEVSVNVPPAEVSVTVEAAQVHVPATQVTVQPAEVNVTLPDRQKTVTFERDPLTQQVTRADVVES
jgi:hypothetical protein